VTVIPSRQSVEVTHTAIFTTVVRGVGNNSFTYRWKRGHRSLKGETGPILRLKNLSSKHEGDYACLVTNMFGDSSVSDDARLTVTSM